jgi:hypothetical protein
MLIHSVKAKFPSLTCFKTQNMLNWPYYLVLHVLEKVDTTKLDTCWHIGDQSTTNRLSRRERERESSSKHATWTEWESWNHLPVMDRSQINHHRFRHLRLFVGSNHLWQTRMIIIFEVDSTGSTGSSEGIKDFSSSVIPR